MVNNQYGSIIGCRGITTEILEIVDNVVFHGVNITVGIAGDGFVEAVFSVFFILVVFGFGNTVGIENNEFTGSDSYLVELDLGIKDA